MKTLKELKNRPTVIHSFETRDLGRIDLLIYEGNHVWQNKMRRIWMPQLYIFSDDMMADFKGANTSRWDSYPRTIRDDVRDWDAACLKNSVQYKVGDWEASWVRQFNVLDRPQRGKIFFEDPYKRQFMLYHIAQICTTNGFDAFDPRMELFQIQKVEVARSMGATSALKQDGLFPGSQQRSSGRQFPDLMPQ